MRCASLVVFRQQPPCQILQRKKVEESKTVCVCVLKHREWACVCHSALSSPSLCGLLQYALIKRNFQTSELRDKSVCLCLPPHKDSTKGAAHRLILLRRQRTLFHFLFYHHSFWGKAKVVISVLPEMPVHRLQYHTLYCWVSKKHPGGNGESYESALCYGSEMHTYVSPLTHTPCHSVQ